MTRARLPRLTRYAAFGVSCALTFLFMYLGVTCVSMTGIVASVVPLLGAVVAGESLLA